MEKRLLKVTAGELLVCFDEEIHCAFLPADSEGISILTSMESTFDVAPGPVTSASHIYVQNQRCRTSHDQQIDETGP